MQKFQVIALALLASECFQYLHLVVSIHTFNIPQNLICLPSNYRRPRKSTKVSTGKRFLIRLLRKSLTEKGRSGNLYAYP